MAEKLSGIYINTEEDIIIEECLKTSLPVSRFPIHEMVPQISLDMDYENISSEYEDELILDSRYSGFGYYVNRDQKEKKAPRALVFQGSYMNSYGGKFMINSFGEYIHIHDYQNVINFPYYFNIFKPDCVIFEVAEYTLNNGYFDVERMKAMDLNPVLDEKVLKNSDILKEDLNSENLLIEEGQTLTDILWKTDEKKEYAWLRLGDDVYDFMKTESGFETTVRTKDYATYK